MKIKLLMGHPTRLGPVFIGRSEDGRFHVMWKDEALGAYGSVVHAVDDVAGGHTFGPSDGADLGELGISDDPDDWLPAVELL